MFVDVSEVRTASIIRALMTLMMKAESTSDMSVNFNVTTRCYIPEDFKLHIENRDRIMGLRTEF
jgi:hypothetical protein